MQKGRANFTGPHTPAGHEKNGRAKLTIDQVTQIRSLAATTTQSELARRFGIGRTQVRRILKGESW